MREGIVYCYRVMNTGSCGIVGWSIATVQDSQLVINALDMEISQRNVHTGGMSHADQGVRFTS